MNRQASGTIGSSRNLPWLLVIVTPLLFAVAAALIAPGADTPWAARSAVDPLGTDEFGRDLLGTAIQAAGASLAKGLAITLVVMTLALVMAEVLTLVASPPASIAIRGLSRVVESIPVVMWVMICVIVLEEFGGFVGGVVYAVVVLPGAINILAGELLRLRHLEYVEAAYLMGVGEWQVLRRHLLPAMGAVLLPYSVQVLGGAIAIDGAIGVIGEGSRQQLDLGMFLVRGKENFQLHPQLLVLTIAMYLLLFSYLLFIARLLASGEEEKR